jgi:hypothetical protein
MASNDPTQTSAYQLLDGKPGFEEVNDFHTNSDVDDRLESQHHTLGIAPYQASPGDHIHDGKSSRKIKFSDIEGGMFNLDGGRADSIYGGVPIIDGGGI